MLGSSAWLQWLGGWCQDRAAAVLRGCFDAWVPSHAHGVDTRPPAAPLPPADPECHGAVGTGGGRGGRQLARHCAGGDCCHGGRGRRNGWAVGRPPPAAAAPAPGTAAGADAPAAPAPAPAPAAASPPASCHPSTATAAAAAAPSPLPPPPVPPAPPPQPLSCAPPSPANHILAAAAAAGAAACRAT